MLGSPEIRPRSRSRTFPPPIPSAGSARIAFPSERLKLGATFLHPFIPLATSGDSLSSDARLHQRSISHLPKISLTFPLVKKLIFLTLTLIVAATYSLISFLPTRLHR